MGQWKADPNAFVNRGRRVVELDLKNKDHIAQALDLIASADALIEGFRPGVMERLGLGPDDGLLLEVLFGSYHQIPVRSQEVGPQ